MAIKNFLTEKQSDLLNKKGWDVNKKGFSLIFYKDEFDSNVWESMCQTADVDPDSEQLSILSFGTNTK